MAHRRASRAASQLLAPVLTGLLCVAMIASNVPALSFQQVAAGTTAADHLVLSQVPSSADPGVTFSNSSQPKVEVQDKDGNVVQSASPVVLTLQPVGTDLSGALTCTATTLVPSSDGVAQFAGCKIDHGGLYKLHAMSGTLTAADSGEIFVSGPARVTFTGQPGGGAGGAAWTSQPQLKVVDGNGVVLTASTAQLGLVIKPSTGAAGAVLACTQADRKMAAVSGVAQFSGCAIDKAATGYQLYGIDITDKVFGTSSTFVITGGAVAKLAFSTQPSGGAGGAALPGQPVVAVQDAAGNTVDSSDAISLTVTSGKGTAGAALSCTAAVTAVHGVATFSGCAIDKVGSDYTLTATDSTSSKSVESAAFAVGAGNASSLTFTTQPSGGAAGAAFGTQPAVTLKDAGGNIKPGSVTLTLTGPSGAALSCAVNPQSAVSTAAAFTGCLVDKPGTGYKLHAVSGGLSVDSNAFDVTVGSPHSLTFSTSPNDSTGGTSFSHQPVVEVKDAGGNPAAGDVTLALTSGSGSPDGHLDCASQTVAAENGVATFSGCDVDVAAAGYSLTATSGTVHGTSARFDITTGDPAKLAFVTQPGDGTGGSALSHQPVVAVEDAGGNLIVGSTAPVRLAVTSGTGSGALSCASNPLPVTRGAAQFQDCRLDRTASAYRLTATQGGLTATSQPFAVTPGAATQLIFTAQPATATAGQLFSTTPTVRVADAGGNGVTGSHTVTLALTPGTGTAGAQLSCSGTQSTNSSGEASFSGCSIDTAAGGYTLRATDGSLHAESRSFPVVSSPPAPLEQAPTGVPAEQTFGGRQYANNPTALSDHVNSATGELLYDTTDLTVAGLGEPFTLTRTYNSADPSVGAFGLGWSSLLDLGVSFNTARTTATVRGEDGQRVAFTWAPLTGTWVPAPGARATLKCSSKACTVTRFDGTSWDVSGTQLLDYQDANGQGLSFGYSGGRLATIRLASTTGVARVVNVTWTGAQVTRVASPTRTVSYGYTGARLTTVTDVLGKTWHLGYDGAQLLTTVTDPLGHDRLVVGYDATTHRVATLSEKGGPRHLQDTFAWNAALQQATRTARTSVDGALTDADYVDTYKSNVLVRQQLPLGSTMRYSYDERVNLTEVQDPHGWVQVMAYSPANDLLSQSTPITSTSASVVRLTYDKSHHVLSQTDPDGNTTVYVYNGPNLGGITPPGPGSLATRLYFDNQGLLTSETNALGRQVFSYDPFGNRTVVIEQTLPGTPLNGAGSLSTYDEAGHQLTYVDARGTTRKNPNAFKSTWTYDAAGNLLSTTTPSGSTSSTYDDAGDLRSTTDARHQTTTYSWNESALQRTVSGPTGDLVQTFDPSGNLLTEQPAGGGTTEHRYDALGRETTTTTPAGLTTHYTFDSLGNVTGIEDTAGTSVQRQFDSRGLLVRSVTNGAATSTTYDPVGNITSYRDAGGALTTRTYDAHNNVASVTDAAGTTTYVYDRADNVVSRRDGNGHVTTYTYDGMSRQTSSTTANHTTTFGYDEVGNVVRTTDPDGRTTYLTLDAANRTVQSDATWAGHPTVTVKQTYDALGRRTSMTDGTGTHTYGYDAAGNLTSANGFSYDYSQPGAIAETYPDGTKVDYTVDDAGHLMTVTSGTPGTSGYVHAAYLRDAARNTTGVAFSNGVLDSRHTDASGNVTSDSLQRAGVALASDAYTYDAAGNRLSQVHTAAGSTVTNTYGYDAANRLTGFSTTSVVAALPPLATSLPVSSSSGVVGGALAPPLSTPDVTPTGSLPPADPAYGYDHVGNRTTWTTPAGTHTASYDASDQLIAETGTGGTATRSYDASGDLTKVVTSTSTRTYSYDAARRLIGVVTTGASPGSVSYTYDGDGNRVTKTAGSSTTKYVWDPFGSLPQLVLETTSAGAPIHRYVYGDGPVAMQTPSATFFFHLDPVGSVTELSDAAGNVVAGYSYDGFGRVTTSGAGAPDNPLLFQGQYLDSDTGLYDMRARNYDPDTGQFTQREPVATPTGRPLVSPYAFVANRPTVSTDPTGQTPTTASVFLGKSTTEANAAQDTRYGTTAATVGVKVTSKLGGYAAAAEAAGMEGAVATSASKVGTGLKFAGVALAVIGIGLQTFVTVESCLHDSVQACVGNVVGTAVSIGFFVGCTALTAGAGAVACALVGGLLSAGLQYVITEFGPQIVQGLVDFGNLTATAFTAGAEIVGQGLVTAGTFLAEQGQVAIGALVSGISTAVAAISSGFQAGMQTLVDAGYTAAQIATVLANTFAQGAQQAISGLVDLGYSIADAANVLKDVFSKTGAQAAQLLKDGFDYTAAQIGGILNTVYGLGDQAAAQILKNVDFAVAEVAAALVSVYHYAAALAATAVATVLDGIGYGVQQIGAALSDVLHQTDVAVATLLKGLDYTVQQIAAVLQDVFADLDQAAATALKGALFVAGEIAAGLRDVYDAVAQRAAELLKTVGFLVNDVATALNSAFTTAAQATAELLKNVGFLVTEIAGALKDVFLQAADAAATALRAIGYFAADVAAGLADAFDKTQQEVAQLLKDVGFVVGEVATALKDFYGLVAKDAAKVLEAIAFTANQVGAALQGVFTQTAATAATLLKDAGFLVAEVAGALQSVFGTVAADAATFLKAAGFAFSEIGAVLSSVFNQAADAAAALLKGIGATAAQIGAVLTSVFNQATDAIAGLLSSIGFSNTAIQAIGGAFTDFGNDVADFFSSLF